MAEGTAVRFVEEVGGAQRVYDFSDLPVTEAVRGWLVRVFARRLGPPAAVRKIVSADPGYAMLRAFARVLAEAWPPVGDVTDVMPRHLEAFRDRYAGLRSQRAYVDLLRGLLRDDPELPYAARAALLALRPASGPSGAKRSRPAEYTDMEWQQITTLLRRDVRVARDRIREGRRLLDRYRRGLLPVGSREEEVGRCLEMFDRTGDVPRNPSGRPSERVSELGGVSVLTGQLCLSTIELTAFALLLTAVTGENFGTVSVWPRVVYRPDASAPQRGGGVALLEARKPRRGPGREHMVTALEDVPVPVPGVPQERDDRRALFRSPLRLYELLLDLTELTQRHGGHDRAFGTYTAWPALRGEHWSVHPRSHHVSQWARTNHFPKTGASAPSGLPPLDVRWLRNTALVRARRPIAHTRPTLNDRYLMGSDQVVRESRGVVASALRGEVDKARARRSVPVLSAEFVARTRTDPQATAREMELSAEAVSALVAGRNDTVLTGCTDHTASPHAESGVPCPASFLACLSCPNARAMPHHLPVQLAAADHLRTLRVHMAPRAWSAKYAVSLQQLGDILDHYAPAEREHARSSVSTQQRDLVAQVFDGRWDLR